MEGISLPHGRLNTLAALIHIGNETRVPENPGNPPIFKPVNPGLRVLKNLGLTGLVLDVKWQFSTAAV